jgi:hypothetical protein
MVLVDQHKAIFVGVDHGLFLLVLGHFVELGFGQNPRRGYLDDFVDRILERVMGLRGDPDFRLRVHALEVGD